MTACNECAGMKFDRAQLEVPVRGMVDLAGPARITRRLIRHTNNPAHVLKEGQE